MTQAERNELAYLFGDICPDEKSHYCDRCGEEITEYAYEVDGGWLCDRCFDDYTHEFTVNEIADRMAFTTNGGDNHRAGNQGAYSSKTVAGDRRTSTIR